MADVNIPGVGRVPSKYVVLGGGVVVLIVGVAYLRHRGTPADSGSAPATSDQSAGSSTYSPDSSYNPVGYGYSNPYPYYGDTTVTPTSTTYSTNSEWAAAAEDALTAQGITTTTSAAAIGKVLAGLTVTTDQKSIFLQAVGLFGDPPQSYPKPIRVSDPTSPTTPTTPTTPKLTAPKNLKVTSVSRNYLGVHWDGVSGAQGYHVDVNGLRYASVSYGTVAIYNLKANTHYTVKVTPFSGSTNGPSASVSATTHK